MKKEVRYFLLITSCVLILTGVLLLVYMLSASNRGNIIDIDIGDSESKSLSFDGLYLLPGESQQYTLNLHTKEDGYHDITFEFSEDEFGELKNYLYVKITIGGRTLHDGVLSELLADEAEAIYYTMNSAYPEEVGIIYYMPESLGNEAQGTRTSFDLVIRADFRED